MPPYDDRFFAPPAAVLNARLRNPQDGAIIPDVLLLIDTGADVTLLPLGAVNATSGVTGWRSDGRSHVEGDVLLPPTSRTQCIGDKRCVSHSIRDASRAQTNVHDGRESRHARHARVDLTH